MHALIRCRGHRLAVVAAAATVALVNAWPARAVADVGSERRPKSVITPGGTFELGFDGSMRFGAEVAGTQYSGSWGFGVAAGFVPSRIYLEVQPVVLFGGKVHDIVVGFNPGFVIDVAGDRPRYGGQATIWASYAHGGRSVWASPLFPFLRAQAVAGAGVTFTGGVMLKLPIPVS